MKPCFYCKGRKFKYIRGEDMKITIKCEKCGGEIITPHLTIDSARGFWNMKMAALEHAAKQKREAAAG